MSKSYSFKKHKLLSISKLLIITAAFCLCFSRANGDNWYTEYWQRVSYQAWEKGPWSFGLYFEMRSQNHFKNMRMFQQSELLAYKVSENFRVELHYTYIHERSVVDRSPWLWRQHLEFEGNRDFPLPRENLLKTRNRLEIRKIQGNPKIQFRLRQLTKFVFPLQNWGKLKAYSIYNEIFYDASTHLFNQDRFHPVVLTVALSDKVKADFFFQFRFFLEQNVWYRSMIIGSQINF